MQGCDGLFMLLLAFKCDCLTSLHVQDAYLEVRIGDEQIRGEVNILADS